MDILFLLFIILSFMVGEKGRTPLESSWNSIDYSFISDFYFIYSSMIYVGFYRVLNELLNYRIAR